MSPEKAPLLSIPNFRASSSSCQSRSYSPTADEALDLLSKESAKTDEYGDTYSPDCLERDSDKLGKDSFMKWGPGPQIIVI